MGLVTPPNKPVNPTANRHGPGTSSQLLSEQILRARTAPVHLAGYWQCVSATDSMTREIANLRLSLRLGLITVDDIVAWADETLNKFDDPPMALVDLSMMGSRSSLDVHQQLWHMSQQIASIDVLTDVLADNVDHIRTNPQLGPHIATVLYEIYVESGYSVPKHLNQIVRLDDAYDLAKTGACGTVEEAFADLVGLASECAKAR